MKEITVQPLLGNLEQVIKFVEDGLMQAECPPKVIFQINIAIDELYSNIAHYSQASAATIQYDIKDSNIILSFVDNGQPYDPTKQMAPDVSLSLEERQIGGLGIFMVSKSMDEMSYKYAEGKNKLTIIKGWQADGRNN